MRLELLEAASYLTVFLAWWGFRRFARRNVAGDMIAGTMVGAFLEFATEPLWDYHFKLTIYKDTPLVVVLGWGVMFTLVVYLSERLYKAILRKDHVVITDKRIFLFDLVGAVVIAMPIEWFGLHEGVWTYRYDRLGWTWGKIPLVGMPYEALVGYCLLMLIAPSFVRLWQGSFEGRGLRLKAPTPGERLAGEAAVEGAEAAALAEEAAVGFTPLYYLSILFFFAEPVAALLKELWPRLPKRAFFSAFAFIAVLGWGWSWLVSASGWWSFGPRFMLGVEVLPHLPIEEVLFYPLGGALAVLAYLCARDERRPPRPGLLWAFLLTGTAIFAGLAAARWGRHPYYVVSQLVVYNTLCGILLAPWAAPKVDVAALALPVAGLGILGFLWNYVGFKYGWWVYHATLGLNVSVEPVDDFNFFLFAPTAAVLVYHAACRLTGSPPLEDA
ncbi:MAG: hypothetical protein KGL53_01475 [Elusimicrobia bacterium]|nr:hypothetical protein [Elusimicrobiota bacterium]